MIKRAALFVVGAVAFACVAAPLRPPVPMPPRREATPGGVPAILELQTPGGPLPFWVHARYPDPALRGPVVEDGAQVSPGHAPTVDVFVTEAERVRPQVLAWPRVWRDAETNERVDRTLTTVLRFEPYGSELEWTAVVPAEGDRHRSGEWRVPGRDGLRRVPVVETGRDRWAWDERRLFDLPDAAPEVPSGRYDVEFSSSDEPAVGVFEVNADGTAFGTFLTTTGDYRYLAGNCAARSLRLAAFDGAHAFLFHAEMQEDGSLAGDFWSGNWWHETWTATPNPEAALPDPFDQTRFTGDAGDLEALTFTGLDGKRVAVGEVAPPGTARVVYVFGSWCPNCHDAARLMGELHERYGPRGLRVVGLAFEHAPGDAGLKRARAYAEEAGADYPILVAGLSDKARAGEAVPVLDRVRSFPTTMFVAPDGSVRAVHTGFAGPATGPEHEALRAAFEGHIEAMLGGTPDSSD